mgnify:CR=1 FL=1
MNNNIKQLRIEKEKIGSWGHLVKSRVDAILKYGGKRVLDVGCSTGAYVHYLCDHGYDASGFDLFLDEKWQGQYKFRFQVADICHIPFKDNSFDTIFAFEVLEHLENPDLA